MATEYNSDVAECESYVEILLLSSHVQTERHVVSSGWAVTVKKLTYRYR